MQNKNISFTVFFSFLHCLLWGQQVSGTVLDMQDQPLPFASIYIKDATLGVTTDAKGRYQFDLKAGAHILVYSYLGFQNVERNIVLKKKENLTLNIVLKEDPTKLGEVQVVSNTKGLGRSIMAKARKNRKKHLRQLETYQCQTYKKLSLDRKLIKPKKEDTLLVIVDEQNKLSKRKKLRLESKNKRILANRAAYFKKDNLQLIETVSRVFYQSPGLYKEKILAQNDYTQTYQPQLMVSINVNDNNIAPNQNTHSNPHILYTTLDPIFNFYQNNIDFSLISSKPILSPLAVSAPLNYRFEYAGSFPEDGQKVFKIKVIPIFKSDALFHGVIFIEDSTFAIKSVDLSINPSAMMGCQDFKILQNYEMVNGQYSLPTRREIVYTIKEGKNTFIGNVSVRHSDYQINTPKTVSFSRNETKLIAKDAFKKDSLFWVNIRPISIKKAELKFMLQADSVRIHHESPAYKQEQDSLFNHIGIWDVLLTGMGYRNSAKGYSFTFSPFIDQIRPFGIGGYRHSLGSVFTKEFKNNHHLVLEGDIDYGFTNKDIKGKVGIGYTYYPKKFVRTFVRFGDFYDIINDYESVEAIFRRSNFVRTKTYSIEQRMEFVNGFFGELTLNYAEQIPITGLQLSQWSKDLFGEQNAPANFDDYKKAEIKLRLQYRPFQKYYFHHNKKIILGSDWPEFSLIYRKGLKGLFGSEVDFDYIELGVKDYRKLGRFGYSNWAAKMGSFVNHRDLRFLEHKFFRGSDIYLFSNPVNSLQLLGPTLNTRNEYVSLNYIHHFDGTILNKVPLIRYLKLELAGGVGSLLIRDINFAHVEFFAGLERKVRIFRQQFRFGIYGVTADNTLDKANLRLKIGANIFDSYTRRWSY